MIGEKNNLIIYNEKKNISSNCYKYIAKNTENTFFNLKLITKLLYQRPKEK